MPTLKIEVWGKRACFTRPEFRIEKVSYDVMTPSAARNILQAIYWHPGMEYHIRSIAVLNPIKFTRLKTNGIKSKANKSEMKRAMMGALDVNMVKPLYTSSCAQQSSMMYLRDVHYVIEATISMTDKANPSDNLTKFYAMVKRRAAKGQCYTAPYLGCREFPANFRLWEHDTMPSQGFETGQRDLGFMLLDMNHHQDTNPDDTRITPMFFRANLINGILNCNDVEVFK